MTAGTSNGTAAKTEVKKRGRKPAAAIGDAALEAAWSEAEPVNPVDKKIAGTVRTVTNRAKRLSKPETAAAAKPASTEGAIIQLAPIPRETILVPVIGITPMIQHRFSEKAKKQMLDAMQGRKTPKTPKDPQAEYEAAFYRLSDGTPGFPVLAFKAATVGAARYYGRDVKMTDLRQFLYFEGELGSDGRQLARIEGDPVMREDVVRVGNGGTDLRYRPEFHPWRTTLRVTYVTSMLTRDSVLALVEGGGMGVGVGEWRPEKDGDFGMFRIDPDRAIVGIPKT